MATHSNIHQVFFIDIETVPQFEKPDFEKHKEMWDIFTKRFEHSSGLKPFVRDHYWEEHYAQTAALYAEHGRVLCVSIGKIHIRPGKQENGEPHPEKFYVRSFCNRDEKKVLTDLAQALNGATILCGHNVKEFDVPFLIRRMIVHQISLPPVLQIQGKKPWEITIEDTMEMWSLTQFKYKVSLQLLCHIFGLPNPKADMDGSKVAEMFYTMFDNMPEGVLPFDREKEVLDKIAKLLQW